MGTTVNFLYSLRTVYQLRDARDVALATVAKLAGMLRDLPDGSQLEERVEHDLCVAMDAHSEAEDAFRKAESRYEEDSWNAKAHTYPTDAYSRRILGR